MSLYPITTEKRGKGHLLTISSHVDELLHHLLPRIEDGLADGHRALKGIVLHVHELLGAEDLEELVVEIARDGLDERERSTDRIGTGKRCHGIKEEKERSVSKLKRGPQRRSWRGRRAKRTKA
jgi:hypothetical protein